MNSAVVARNVNFFYGDRIILKDLSFSVTKGDFFIIIGPNGSGKTTLLKIIANLLRIKKGSLQIMGYPMENYSRRSLARTLCARTPDGPCRLSLYSYGTCPDGSFPSPGHSGVGT